MTAGPTEVGIFVRRNESAGDGLRVVIKDILDRAGEVTTGGSRSLATSAAATQSSDVVLLLEQAGCSIVGRANMHELAYGVTGINHWSGTPTNPRYAKLIPGGSSSGSAVAVAAGLVDFSIGSDTGGSIRIPAACCGIVGLKPTFGRVSRIGAVPAITSLDCIGPFARDVAKIETAMSIIIPGWAPCDDQRRGRIGLVGGQADEAIDTFVRASAQAQFECEDVRLPLFTEAVDAGIKVIGRESWNAFGHLVASGLVGVDVGARLELASKVTDEQLGIAEATRRAFTAEVDDLLSRFDAIALPTLPVLPPSLLDASDAKAAIPITMNCRPFNLSGHPAISLPVGEYNGAPVALQLVGRKGEDEFLCALARQVTLFQ